MAVSRAAPVGCWWPAGVADLESAVRNGEDAEGPEVAVDATATEVFEDPAGPYSRVYRGAPSCVVLPVESRACRSLERSLASALLGDAGAPRGRDLPPPTVFRPASAPSVGRSGPTCDVSIRTLNLAEPTLQEDAGRVGGAGS